MPFLHLPAEIRNQIYNEALVEDAVILLPIRKIQEPDLLFINHQIRKESGSIYWSTNTFHIDTPNFDSTPLLHLQTKLAHFLGPDFNPQNIRLNPYQLPCHHHVLKWLERYHEGTIKVGYPDPGMKSANPCGRLWERNVVYSIFQTVRQRRADPWKVVRGWVLRQFLELAEKELLWAFGLTDILKQYGVEGEVLEDIWAS